MSIDPDILAGHPTAERRVYTVSRLNLEAQGLLEGSFPLIWLEAELSNLSRPASGHLYFSLKDDRAQVTAAMFRNRNQMLRFTPRNGQQVLVRARITLYVPRGSFQLVVEHMKEAGEGRLRQQFEALKEKLRAEGLFESDRKRPLPALPRQIGVITSPSGAVIRDILHVLKRRCPQIPVLIYPAAVQGRDAPAQLRAALALANARQECDVLILARGGGSLEDLWAFNDEQLARDVAASGIPVVSAVGHEVDTGLTDFAADMRAPTPSAAAELVGPDLTLFTDRLKVAQRRQARQMQLHLLQQAERLTALRRRLRHPRERLEQHAQQLDELDARLQRQMRHQLALAGQQAHQLSRRLQAQNPSALLARRQQTLDALARRLVLPAPRQLKQTQRELAQLGQRLHTASPLATLGRGYSISFVGDTALRSVAAAQSGDRLRTRLADGEVESEVLAVHPGPDSP
jgi:exodeoxyribonuclease VII large subunit